MYKVRVEFYIRSNEKEELTIPFAVAYRDTDLPFAPFIGLRFHFGIGAAEQLPTIKIAWNDKEQSFRCRLEDDLSGYGAGIHGLSYDESNRVRVTSFTRRTSAPTIQPSESLGVCHRIIPAA